MLAASDRPDEETQEADPAAAEEAQQASANLTVALDMLARGGQMAADTLELAAEERERAAEEADNPDAVAPAAVQAEAALFGERLGDIHDSFAAEARSERAAAE